MINTLILAFAIYLLVISLITIIVTISDKKRAIKHKYRVPEATLLTLGALGGAFAEYVTMKKIRHKTLHKKFMIGLPLIMILQLLAVGSIIYLIVSQNI